MGTPQAHATFEQALSQARAAVRAGQSASAEARLRQLCTQRPDDLNATWLLGIALLDQGKLAESTSVLEGLVARRPDFLDARVDLARAYRGADRAQEAREQVRRVLESVPHHHRAWLAYADALVDLGQFDDARMAFERARLTDPQRARIDEATSAMLAGDRRASEGIFRDILREDASHLAALCGLAALSLTADKPADAERLLRHALKQSAYLPLIYRGFAPALIAMGRTLEADVVTRHLIKIEPGSPQTWVTVAAVATRLMRQERALEAYLRAAALEPKEVGLRISAGHVQKTLGRRADSEASYKAALQIDPGGPMRGGAWQTSRTTRSPTTKYGPCSRSFKRLAASARMRRS